MASAWDLICRTRKRGRTGSRLKKSHRQERVRERGNQRQLDRYRERLRKVQVTLLRGFETILRGGDLIAGGLQTRESSQPLLIGNDRRDRGLCRLQLDPHSRH